MVIVFAVFRERSQMSPIDLNCGNVVFHSLSLSGWLVFVTQRRAPNMETLQGVSFEV